MSAYLTSAQLLATLGITSPSSEQTTDANNSINAACGAIDLICQRGRNAFNVDGTVSTRYYSPVNPSRLEIDDLSSVTGLVVNSRDDGGNVDTADSGLNTWTINTDFVLEPLNAAVGTSVDLWPYERLVAMPLGSFTFNTYYPRSVKVIGKFGWPQVPAGILEAAADLSERLYKMKREAPLGVIAFEQLAVRVARADANVMILLAPYMKHIHGIA